MKRILLVLALTMIAGSALAADSYLVTNGTCLTIQEHSVCRGVDNATGQTIMVPTKTANEWHTGGSSFIDNPPTGVTLNACSGNYGKTLLWSGNQTTSGTVSLSGDADDYDVLFYVVNTNASPVRPSIGWALGGQITNRNPVRISDEADLAQLNGDGTQVTFTRVGADNALREVWGMDVGTLDSLASVAGFSSTVLSLSSDADNYDAIVAISSDWATSFYSTDIMLTSTIDNRRRLYLADTTNTYVQLNAAGTQLSYFEPGSAYRIWRVWGVNFGAAKGDGLTTLYDGALAPGSSTALSDSVNNFHAAVGAVDLQVGTNRHSTGTLAGIDSVDNQENTLVTGEGDRIQLTGSGDNITYTNVNGEPNELDQVYGINFGIGGCP